MNIGISIKYKVMDCVDGEFNNPHSSIRDLVREPMLNSTSIQYRYYLNNVMIGMLDSVYDMVWNLTEDQ
jgi:hypothetical protein